MGKVQKVLLVDLPRWEARSVRDSLQEDLRDFLEVESVEAPMKILAYEPDMIIASGGSLEEIISSRDDIEKKPPIIILSKDKKMINNALFKGCEDYILKPFEPFEMVHRTERYLPVRKESEGIQLGPAPESHGERNHQFDGLESGHIYLVTEPKPVRGFEIFKKDLMKGITGLSFSRRHPKEIRNETEGFDIDAIWLTANMDKEETCFDTKDMTKITRTMDDFIKKNRQGLIYFDGLEYLVSQTDFQSVLRLLQFINDKIMASDDRMLISIDPRAFTSQQMSLIERECVVWDS